MDSSIFESPKNIKIIRTKEPEIGKNEVLVKLSGTGLCASNLPVWEGREWFKYPLEPGSPGHEGYGIVEDYGANVIGLKKGDRVALLSYNAYAQYDKADVKNVVKLPPDLHDIPFPGEPAACAVNIFKRADIKKGQTVVVVGAGYIGCLLIQLIKNKGAGVIAVSRRDSSLKYAERSGADILVKFDDIWDAVKEVKEHLPNGASRVIEATGIQRSLDLSTEIIGERGKLIIAGYHQDGLRNINMQIWNWKGIDVINAHERDQDVYISGLKEAIELTRKGILRPSDLITHDFDFSDINHAFEILHDKPEGFLKAIIHYS